MPTFWANHTQTQREFMQLKVFKALWGDAEGRANSDDFRRIRAAGYDGIEWAMPETGPETWRAWCEEHQLEYIAMIFADDAASFAKQLRAAAAYEPVRVTAHDGRDKMTFDAGCQYWREVLKAEADIGIPVAHETHRHRLLFSPWSTAAYLNEFPELRLCADFSHWCCVCESLLRDMPEWVELACSRAIHVHGRVGWEESAQVADPRAPEVQHYVERHEELWDRIREHHQSAGAATLTFTPEYGPPGYMPALPFTRQPITNLWDICLWSAERIRARWGA